MQQKLPRRFKSAALVAAMSGVGWVVPALADTGTPGASGELICKSDPKLVVCKVVFSTTGGFVSWADATIEEAPALARPVWSYAKFKRDGVHEPNLRFGLIPKTPGKGTLAVRVRAEVCPTEGSLCIAYNRLLKATVIIK
ncbi:MAG TPA: hypothetical protein VGI10_21990 [Polyangiaceae bacterium]